MDTSHNVISAFLDDEPFEPQALADALAEPAGRAMLIDLISLRHLAQMDDPLVVTATIPRRRSWRPLLAAAAIVIALVGGYGLGQKQRVDAVTRAPEPTRVLAAAPAWQGVSAGGAR